MGCGGFLPEKISAAGNSMMERDGRYADDVILVEYFVGGGVNSVELNGVAQRAAEHVNLLHEYSFQLFRGVYVQGCRPSKEREGGDDSHQTEAMVTMKMGDEDGVYLVEWYVLTT